MKFKAAVTGLLVAMPIAGNYYFTIISGFMGLYRAFIMGSEMIRFSMNNVV